MEWENKNSIVPTNKYKKELCSFCVRARVCVCCVVRKILHVHFNYIICNETLQSIARIQTQLKSSHGDRLPFFDPFFYSDADTHVDDDMNTAGKSLVHVCKESEMVWQRCRQYVYNVYTFFYTCLDQCNDTLYNL